MFVFLPSKVQRQAALGLTVPGFYPQGSAVLSLKLGTEVAFGGLEGMAWCGGVGCFVWTPFEG